MKFDILIDYAHARKFILIIILFHEDFKQTMRAKLRGYVGTDNEPLPLEFMFS
jgi:hypothetical protein